jgi:hypothetical protein
LSYEDLQLVLTAGISLYLYMIYDMRDTWFIQQKNYGLMNTMQIDLLHMKILMHTRNICNA